MTRFQKYRRLAQGVGNQRSAWLGVALLFTGATTHALIHAASAKSVSLQLSDVRHVLGNGLTANDARYSTPHAMGVCTTTPPITDYLTTFSGPLHTKGVLSVISDVYTYKSVAGPICNQKLDIANDKTLGSIIGKLTTVHGVGTQAFVLDTTGPKSQGPSVYTLALKFTRSVYRGIIIVQSNRKINPADMVALGKIVDRRMQHGG